MAPVACKDSGQGIGFQSVLFTFFSCSSHPNLFAGGDVSTGATSPGLAVFRSCFHVLELISNYILTIYNCLIGRRDKLNCYQSNVTYLGPLTPRHPRQAYFFSSLHPINGCTLRVGPFTLAILATFTQLSFLSLACCQLGTRHL